VEWVRDDALLFAAGTLPAANPSGSAREQPTGLSNHDRIQVAIEISLNLLPISISSSTKLIDKDFKMAQQLPFKARLPFRYLKC
jgi:hypothetical protein